MNMNFNLKNNKYTLFFEKGWWTSWEVICIFLGHSPSIAKNAIRYNELVQTPEGQHIAELVQAAIRDGSIKNFQLEPKFWSNRAPCKDWLEWSLSKPSIHLDSLLIETAGISLEDNSRTNESYRPKDEKMIKLNFVSLAKLILHMCPKARLSDITQLIESSGAIIDLPSDRTLRKWLKLEQISLHSSKLTDYEVAEVQKKLAPLLQAYSSS